MADEGVPFTIEMQKMSFRSICTAEEIERIFNVQNAKDYLLKIRAETIVDHMRLFRVYMNRARPYGDSWSLEKSFVETHYTQFLSALSPDLRQQCSSITAGNLFSTEANGFAFNTEYGPVVTICDSLQYFLKFMHLGLMNISNSVPIHVAMNSVRIALRVMLRTETLDFRMDPRGILPKSVYEAMHAPIPLQMQFIAGHEYAHHILGHVPANSTTKRPILRAMFKNQDDYGFEKIYSYAQKQEFEADTYSITLANYDDYTKKNILEAALLWFACLDLYELVHEIISPAMQPPNHPPARDRFHNLLESIKIEKGFNHHKWQKVLARVDAYKTFIIEDVAVNMDFYEIYGSAYLDKPNTKWRGKELIDRVDYY